MLILSIGDFYIPDRAIEIPLKFHRLLSSSSSANKIQKVLCLGNITSSHSTLEFIKSISSDFAMVKGEFDQDLNTPLSLVFKCENFKIGIISGYNVIPQNDPLSLLTQARLMDVDILIWGGSSKVEAYTLDGKFFINPGSATGLLNFNALDKEDLEIIENELSNAIDSNDNEKEVPKLDTDEGRSETPETKQTDDEDEKEEETTAADDDDNNDDNDKDNTVEDTIDVDITVNTTKETTEEQSKLLEELISPIPSFCLLDVKGSLCVTYIYTLIDNEVKIDKINHRKD